MKFLRSIFHSPHAKSHFSRHDLHPLCFRPVNADIGVIVQTLEKHADLRLAALQLHLHRPVRTVAYIPGHTQAPCQSACTIAKTYILYSSITDIMHSDHLSVLLL